MALLRFLALPADTITAHSPPSPLVGLTDEQVLRALSATTMRTELVVDAYLLLDELEPSAPQSIKSLGTQVMLIG